VSTLHITNGDCAADTLRTFLADPVIITADPLFEGPAPDVDDARWYALRGGELAGHDGGERDIAAELAASDCRIAEAVRCGSDIVLWFEHDLFDQLLLIRTLDRIRKAARGSLTATGGISLIGIDRFPGVERFIGLGQLTAEQLATLVEHKQPVTGQQFDHAARAWAAFRADNPSALAGLSGPGSLPFLGAALRRLLEEYPSTFNGLSRSAMQALQVLAEGPLDAGALFVASQQLEEHPFMGDWSLFNVLRSLAGAPVPLVTIRPDPTPVDLRGHTVEATEAGQRVRAGRQDAIALNGIDEWRGTRNVDIIGGMSRPHGSSSRLVRNGRG
jgi:hypothetical protein